MSIQKDADETKKRVGAEVMRQLINISSYILCVHYYVYSYQVCMYNYVLSFKFEGKGNAAAERFAKASAALLKKLREESTSDVENLRLQLSSGGGRRCMMMAMIGTMLGKSHRGMN